MQIIAFYYLKFYLNNLNDVINYFKLIFRDDQFKAPKRKVSIRRRIESHPTDVHKGIYQIYLLS